MKFPTHENAATDQAEINYYLQPIHKNAYYCNYHKTIKHFIGQDKKSKSFHFERFAFLCIISPSNARNIKFLNLKNRTNTEFFKCIKITAEIKIIRTNKQQPHHIRAEPNKMKLIKFIANEKL